MSECSSFAESCGAHSAATAEALAPRPVGAPRILVFSSAHCPACRRIEPRLDRAVKACGGEGGLLRVDVDAETGSALPATYDVTTIPSLVSIDGSGVEVSRMTGVQPQEQIERALEEVRGIRCATLSSDVEDRLR